MTDPKNRQQWQPGSAPSELVPERVHARAAVRGLTATAPWATAARVAVDIDDWRPPDLGGRPLCAEADPEAFFPDKGRSTTEAKKICKACPVQVACLQWAMDNGERFGVWGGLSDLERRRLRQTQERKQRERQITHGKESGYRAHLRRKETPCNACRDANALARAERAAS